jgi:hypothetical protein
VESGLLPPFSYLVIEYIRKANTPSNKSTLIAKGNHIIFKQEDAYVENPIKISRLVNGVSNCGEFVNNNILEA